MIAVSALRRNRIRLTAASDLEVRHPEHRKRVDGSREVIGPWILPECFFSWCREFHAARLVYLTVEMQNH